MLLSLCGLAKWWKWFAHMMLWVWLISFGECRVVNTLWRLAWADCWNRVGRHIDTINDNREMLKESIWMIVKYSRCLWACVSDLRKITSTHEKPYYINGHLCMKLNKTMTRNKIKVKSRSKNDQIGAHTIAKRKNITTIIPIIKYLRFKIRTLEICDNCI